MRLVRAVMPWIAALALIFLWWADCRAQIPEGAHRYRQEYQRIVRSELGLSAPVSSLAAQIHQESGWDCRAISRVKAAGCAQFMPTTAKWIGEVDHRLAAGDLHSPQWGFRAQAVYMGWLAKRVQAENSCEQMAFAMSAYNGGLGYVYKRQKASRSPGVCMGMTCAINPGILESNQRENEHYPRRILKEIAPRYLDTGWGPSSC